MEEVPYEFWFVQALRAFGDPGVAAVFARQAQEIQGRPQPTRFQDPVISWMLERVSQRIATAAKLMNLEPSRRPIFATLPLTSLQAKSVVLPGTGQPVIFLSHRVFGFAYETAYVIAELARFEGPIVHMSPDVTANLARTSEAAAQSLLRVLLRDAPLEMYRHDASSEFVSILTQSMEAFIVGHEYAHIVMRDASDVREALDFDSNPASAYEAIVYSWQQEVRADCLGAWLVLQDLVLETNRNQSDAALRIGMLGPELAIVSMSIEEQGRALLTTDQRMKPSHEDVAAMIRLFDDEFLISHGLASAPKIQAEEHIRYGYPPIEVRLALFRKCNQANLKILGVSEKALPDDADIPIAPHGTGLAAAMEILLERVAPILRNEGKKRASRARD